MVEFGQYSALIEYQYRPVVLSLHISQLSVFRDLGIEGSTTKLTLTLSPWLIRWGNIVMRNLQISGCSYRTAL